MSNGLQAVIPEATISYDVRLSVTHKNFKCARKLKGRNRVDYLKPALVRLRHPEDERHKVVWRNVHLVIYNLILSKKCFLENHNNRLFYITTKLMVIGSYITGNVNWYLTFFKRTFPF